MAPQWHWPEARGETSDMMDILSVAFGTYHELMPLGQINLTATANSVLHAASTSIPQINPVRFRPCPILAARVGRRDGEDGGQVGAQRGEAERGDPSFSWGGPGPN